MVRLARKSSFLAVIGNHELASLGGHAARQGGAKPEMASKYAWTDGLGAGDLEYLRQLPLTISLPRLGALVVHAGLEPGASLPNQDAVAMVSMRNVKRTGDRHIPIEQEADGAVAWSSVWEGPQHVYFGHDAKRKLQLEKHATGLDTGCVYGGALTAAILEKGAPPRLVSVAAKEMYSMPTLNNLGKALKALKRCLMGM